MPKPCPRCGLENTDDATHCSRCDARLRDAAAISPAFRRVLLGMAGFVVITTIGVAALVYVHETAVPLGDPVVPTIDQATRDEAFAREQGLEAPPALTGPSETPTVAGAAPTSPQAPSTTAGAPPVPGESPLPPALDPLLEEEDVTAQMPAIPSGVEWNREILPPTYEAPPAMPEPVPPLGVEGDPGLFPESNPFSSAPPVAQPGTDPLAGESPAASGTEPQAPPGGQELPGTGSPNPAAATQEGGSLATAQQAQCANEGFLTRFVCHERVRLAYCENRWNRHPDCMVDSNATNY